MPRVTFTDPEIGSVGLTEAEARQAGGDVRCPSRCGLSPRAGSTGRGLREARRRDGVLVGGTSMGPFGGEVLSMLGLAVHAEIPSRRCAR